MDKLERALQRAEGDGGGVLVVVDGVFSMEGDVAPLVDIVDLCERHGARLMVDEAHGAGVLGARGAGATELLGVEERVDLRMGTFSKSLAACGGFVVGSADVIDYLRISSRAFLFTASAVPAALGAALAALRIIRSPEGAALLAEVLENARYLGDGLTSLGYRTLGGEPIRLRLDRTARSKASSPRSSLCSSATIGRRRYSGARSTTAACSPTARSIQPCLPAARSCARA